MAQASALRFVVLHHTGWAEAGDHYDLLLQTAPGDSDGSRVLAAFATLDDEFPQPRQPTQRSGPPSVVLRRLPDHRRFYLRHQGAVSGGRGQVARVDEGALTFDGPAPGPGEECHFSLAGRRLKGQFRLRPGDGEAYFFEQVT